MVNWTESDSIEIFGTFCMIICATFAFVFSLICGIFMVIGDVGFIHGQNLGGGIALIVLSGTGIMSMGGVFAGAIITFIVGGIASLSRKICCCRNCYEV